jgi:hypothetical protein
MTIWSTGHPEINRETIPQKVRNTIVMDGFFGRCLCAKAILRCLGQPHVLCQNQARPEKDGISMLGVASYGDSEVWEQFSMVREPVYGR